MRRRSRELLYSPETLKLEILTTPVKRLGLKIRGTLIDEAIRRTREDTARVGLTQLNPTFYLSDAYGCVEGTTNIAVGFYDCSELLRELNKEFRGWRQDPADILQILRHEIGHAFCYAYKLYRSKEFRHLFNVKGHFFHTYPAERSGHRQPDQWSADYVNPAGDFYAQKHPDEDFAETFSVWLNPEIDWRVLFARKQGALRKLHYVERVVNEFGRQDTQIGNGNSGALDMPMEQLSMTTAQFFKTKSVLLKTYRRQAMGYVDTDLRELFQGPPRVLPVRRFRREYHRASSFLRSYKRLLVNRVAYWVNIEESIVTDLVDKLILRCRVLDRYAKVAETERKLIQVTAYLTVLCRNFKETEQFQRRR